MWWLVLGWSAGWVLLWRLPRLDSRSPEAPSVDPHTSVAVVIPARNEADRIPLLLDSLGRQTRAPDRIVVVDDGSSDGTGAIARGYPSVDVVDAPPVPDGWTGKSWACATGVGTVPSDVLVFLDADVVLDDGALDSVLAEHQRTGGLLSVQPHHHIGSPVEALSLPFNVITMMGTGTGSLVRSRSEWAAAGPCMVTSTADYHRIGGHRSVRGEVAEDLALAQRFRRSGLPVRCIGGGDLVWFRMYRDLRGVVQGWGKNVATGAGRTPPLRTAAVILWVAALLRVAHLAVATIFTGTDVSPAVVAVAYAAVTVQVALMARQVGRFGPAALLWPLLLAFFVSVFAWSSIRTLLVHQVTWSGRSIRVAPRH